jgi:hypothetical protein
MPGLKINEELAADIRARVKAFDFGAVEKLRKAEDKNGTFDVIISTEDIDRAGEIVKQSGWELVNYKNNPIVLWGHDYYSLPIGVCLETYLTEKDGVPALGARGVFLSADINPLAQQIRKLYEFGLKQGAGVGTTTSVGFIPKEFDEKQRNVITKAELLEFSFVPVPANQGVGPAAGRAITFAEAKELDLDIAGLKVKGIEFAEKAEDDDEAQEGDDCTGDDGSTGVLAKNPKDPKGPLVCVPKEDDKSKTADRKPEKELIKVLADEHARHIGEVEKAVDDFREKQEEDGASVADNLKDLRSSLLDENTMHRAKAIACLRGFEADNKSFDRKAHLKTLRDEDDAYSASCKAALEQFEERCTKATPEDIDGHVDWFSNELEKAQRAHKKSLTKIAKAMCRDIFGEEEQADEQVVAILKEYLAPHIDPLILNSVVAKVGARVSATTKERLREAHEHLKSASAILEALHGGLADDDGEEKSAVDDTIVTTPVNARSRTRSSSRSEDPALKAHLQAREIVGGIEAAARAALGTINTEIRNRSKQ